MEVFLLQRKKIKLIAFDLDGTLLNSKKEISERTRHCLKKVHENDIFVVPATGRAYHALPKSILEFTHISYFITSNGASLLDKNGKIIKSSYVCPSIADILLKKVQNQPIMIEFISNGFTYTEKKYVENLNLYGITNTHAQYIYNTRHIIDDIEQFMKEKKNYLENINLIFFNSTQRKEFFHDLSKQNEISVTFFSDKNLEITAKSATKGTCLNELCQSLHIRPQEVIAFGDNENDKDMLCFAGISVAMENASPNLKEISNFVTLSCDSDGVAHVLEKLSLFSPFSN